MWSSGKIWLLYIMLAYDEFQKLGDAAARSQNSVAYSTVATFLFPTRVTVPTLVVLDQTCGRRWDGRKNRKRWPINSWLWYYLPSICWSRPPSRAAGSWPWLQCFPVTLISLVDRCQSYNVRRSCRQLEGSRFTIWGDACPFHASMLTCLAGWPNAWIRRRGKLVNALLLSLMRRVWVYAAIP